VGKNRLHGNPQGVGVKRKKGSHCLDYSAGHSQRFFNCNSLYEKTKAKV